MNKEKLAKKIIEAEVDSPIIIEEHEEIFACYIIRCGNGYRSVIEYLNSTAIRNSRLMTIDDCKKELLTEFGLCNEEIESFFEKYKKLKGVRI